MPAERQGLAELVPGDSPSSEVSTRRLAQMGFSHCWQEDKSPGLVARACLSLPESLASLAWVCMASASGAALALACLGRVCSLQLPSPGVGT